MATRPRTSGNVAGRTTQATGRPVYKDFEPMFEWREEPAANFLSVSLPGFVKEQIKVTYDERLRTVKVRGERPLGDNRFSRFGNDFSVPENCKPGEIRGKFERGTLVLTLPKKTIPQVPPKEAPPQVTAQKQSLSTEKEPKSPKVGRQNVPPKTNSSDVIGKKKGDDKVVAGAKEAIDQPTKKPKDQQTPHDKGNKTSSQKEDIAQRTGEIAVSRKNNNEARLDDERQKLSIPKAVSGKQAIETEGLVGAVKRAVKGLTTGLSEDRQLVVNMGVAIVAIVALGAYLSYKYGSSTEAED